MTLKVIYDYKPFITFLVLAIFCCLPVWYYEYFINQDGSAHLYNSYIILELIKGNANFTEYYSINPYPIPNLTGHWIMSFFLLFFSPTLVTKITVSITFCGVIATCVWLRLKTVGQDGLILSILIGTVLAFNWLWFLGFYNFILGFIGYIFTLGLFWHWRNQFNLKRTFLFAACLVFVFLSHLISFGMLLGSVLLISVISINNRKTNYTFFILSILPCVPLLISYKILTGSGGEISPNWFHLQDIFSISEWIMHLQAADPFQLISRKAFPFLNDFNLFAILSAFFWLMLIFVICLIITFIKNKKDKDFLWEKLPWFLIILLSILFWLIAPDDFGKSHGSFLRERILLCGLVCFIPIFDLTKSNVIKFLSHSILIFIIIFQTLVLWEYSYQTNSMANNYLKANKYIKDSDKIASIILSENTCRYKANPLTNLNPLLGIGKNTRIWDNYELGYYLFPVVVNSSEEKNFIYEYRLANAFDLCNKNELFDGKWERLKKLLETNHERFSVLTVWNGNEQIFTLLEKDFYLEAEIDNNKVTIYRHK